MRNEDRKVPASAAAPAAGEAKPWTAPRLMRLGTVAALTAKRDNIGKKDGGGGGKSKT